MRNVSPLRGLPIEQQTLPALLDLQAERHGDRVLLRDGETALTVAEMRDAAARTAGMLQEAGIRRGDSVATMSENRRELLELWLGCAWIGAVYLPINTALRGKQLEHVVKDGNSQLLVVAPEFAEIAPSAPQVWRFNDYPNPGNAVTHISPRPGDTCALLYTSGTTGPSKGVRCPQAQWYWWGVTTGEALQLDEDDVLYTCMPLFHTNALNTFVQALIAGATFVLGPRFSASQMWQRLAESDATVTFLLGAMVHMLLKRDDDPFGRQHRVRVALSPATPAALHEEFRTRFGVRLVDGWGSTETNYVLSTAFDGAPAGSMGAVLPDFEARVVDENDSEQPPGMPGELVVRAKQPNAFANGYHGLSGKTVEAWRNLWLHTGDRVVRDEQGWWWFVDRLSDSIRRRGENISSFEVETVLAEHDAVAASAVVPVPSEIGEEEVLAYVVQRTGKTVDPVELIRFCSSRLAYFAIPRYIDFVDELPLTPSGKIQKYKLRERGLAATAWDRDAAGVQITG